MNEINVDYIGSPEFRVSLAINAMADSYGYIDFHEECTAEKQEVIEAAFLASTGCIDPPETPEPQNPMLQAWIRHCRLPLGSTRPNSKLALPYDPTIPIGQAKSSALLTVAKIDHRFGGAK